LTILLAPIISKISSITSASGIGDAAPVVQSDQDVTMEHMELAGMARCPFCL
jgi:hypothetical protein